MRKPLGRLAAVVAASALITFAAAPAAFADDTDTVTTTSSSSSAVETPTSSASEAPSSSSASTSESAPSSSSAATTSSSAETTESSKPTQTSKPTSGTSSPTSSSQAEPPYEDNVAGGADLPEGFGFVVVACAGGEPKNLSSPSFDVLEGPYQEEQDGRYWDYLVQRHEGVSFDDPNQHIEASWECPAPQGGGASTGGDITPIPGTGDADAWQASNGGKPQVRYAPKTGVETGFGGTAQG